MNNYEESFWDSFFVFMVCIYSLCNSTKCSLLSKNYSNILNVLIFAAKLEGDLVEGLASGTKMQLFADTLPAVGKDKATKAYLLKALITGECSLETMKTNILSNEAYKHDYYILQMVYLNFELLSNDYISPFCLSLLAQHPILLDNFWVFEFCRDKIYKSVIEMNNTIIDLYLNNYLVKEIIAKKKINGDVVNDLDTLNMVFIELDKYEVESFARSELINIITERE